MKTRIICENVDLIQIQEAFTLGDYDAKDENILQVEYKIFHHQESLIIEFQDDFLFCDILFVIIDLLETTRQGQVGIKAYCDTDINNKITSRFEGERVCIYLANDIHKAMQLHDDYLDYLDLVTASNKNYSIEIDRLFSYQSKDKTLFEEPSLDLDNMKPIKEGIYLYEFSDFESEYIEDYQSANN